MRSRVRSIVYALLLSTTVLAGERPPLGDDGAPVDFTWGVRIPMRDGARLSATLYRPHDQKEPLPCIFTLTPYIAQRSHDRGVYFATHGYVFLTVDVRGRGDSEGRFNPFLQEANDGPDVVEWLAKQSYCNGKVAMWGISYAGYDQWATAKEMPPHLATIVPGASPRPGLDFPWVNGVYYPYDIQWLTFTSGHASQEVIFDDDAFWAAQFGRMYSGHRAFRELDALVGNPSPIFQAWVAHPRLDDYWDRYNPTPQQLARIQLPILTITGQYDDDQPGALAFYREHMANTSEAARGRHYLLVGPWDHTGTRTPRARVSGLEFGPASVIDMNELHRQWYDWTLKGGGRPLLLKDRVAYYVLGEGAEEWRVADSLAAVTASSRPVYLSSQGGSANDVFTSGTLTAGNPTAESLPDRYVYDPLDTTFSAWEALTAGSKAFADQGGLLACSGKILVYHTPAFAEATDLAGFFELSAWISLDQPDTDIAAAVYEIKADGSSTFLSMDLLRARHRTSLREAVLAKPGAVERYDFARFAFIARRVAKGSRLRLVLGPMNSRYMEKNYNSGGDVAAETGKEARTVTVTLYHDSAHPSALNLPIAAPIGTGADRR